MLIYFEKGLRKDSRIIPGVGISQSLAQCGNYALYAPMAVQYFCGEYQLT